MKFFVVLGVAFLCFAADTEARNKKQQQATENKNEIQLFSARDSFSYVMGMEIANSLSALSAELDKNVLVAAIIENFNAEKKARIDEETANEILTNNISRIEEERRIEEIRRKDPNVRRDEINRIRRQIDGDKYGEQ